MLFPTESSWRPNTEAVARRSPQRFSIRGETAEEGPLGQNWGGGRGVTGLGSDKGVGGRCGEG